MFCSLNTHLIYHISDFLDVENQKAYLLTEKEASYSLKFDAYYKKLQAVKIQKWWRRFIAQTFIPGCYGYSISYEKLVANWSRFRGRQIQFIQKSTTYNYVNGNGNINLNNYYDSYTASPGVIYTLTCLNNIVYTRDSDYPYLTVGIPGFYNMNVDASSLKFPNHHYLQRTHTMQIGENFIFNKIIYVITRCDTTLF